MNDRVIEYWLTLRPNRLHESELMEAVELAIGGDVDAVAALMRHIRGLERDLQGRDGQRRAGQAHKDASNDSRGS